MKVLVNDFLAEQEIFFLPNSLRKELSKPIGELYIFQDGLSPEQQILKNLTNYNGLVMTVGDVVTDSLFSLDFFPNFAFIDNKTLRDCQKLIKEEIEKETDDILKIEILIYQI